MPKSSAPDRVMPQDLEAEQSTLGSMLVEQGAAQRALLILKADDFYRDAHKAIFEAALQASRGTAPVDLVTVSTALREAGKLDAVGGPEYLTILIDGVPTAAHVVRYAQIVRDTAKQRRLIEWCGQTIADAYDWVGVDKDGKARDVRQLLQEKVAELMRMAADREIVARSMKDIMAQLVTRLMETGHATDMEGAVRTGLPTLDAMIGGFLPGQIALLIAGTKIGKSSASWQWAQNMAVSGAPVLYISLEMEAAELGRKAIAYWSGTSDWKLTWEKISDRDLQNALEGAEAGGKLPIMVCDEVSLDVYGVCGMARTVTLGTGVGVLFVDYVQLMKPHLPHGTRTENVADQVLVLRDLARELNVPIVAVAQRGIDDKVFHSMEAVFHAHKRIVLRRPPSGTDFKKQFTDDIQSTDAAFDVTQRGGKSDWVRLGEGVALFPVDFDHSRLADPAGEPPEAPRWTRPPTAEEAIQAGWPSDAEDRPPPDEPDEDNIFDN